MELGWFIVAALGFGVAYAFRQKPQPAEHDAPDRSRREASRFPECWACGVELTPNRRATVPTGVECCDRCWAKVPITDRLKITMDVRDRQPGGILYEGSDLIQRAVEEKRQLSEGETP